MSRLCSALLFSLALPLLALGADTGTRSPFQALLDRSQKVVDQAAPPELPPPAPDTIVFSFKDIFEPVIGDRGPSFQKSFRAWEGRTVRITGHVARETSRTPGVFLLTPWPAKVENDGFCVWDELPPQTLHVLLPAPYRAQPVPFLPGAYTIEGHLRIQPAELMPDGRNAIAAIQLTEESVRVLFPALTPALLP